MLNVSSKILVPLCGEVILENRFRHGKDWRRYKDVLGGLKGGDIGMGSVHTWHGTPDVRVRGTEVVCRRATEEEFVVDEVLSDDEAMIEEMVMTGDANLHQAIGTCVVSSFTEKSLHPDLQALVPTVLIDETQFRVCLYDSEKDVLLISESKSLATKGGLSRSGMALLWLVINHRLFLKQLPDHFGTKYPAKIKSRLEANGSLQHFTDLKDKKLYWGETRKSKDVGNSHLPLTYVHPTPPPPKKRRKCD